MLLFVDCTPAHLRDLRILKGPCLMFDKESKIQHHAALLQDTAHHPADTPLRGQRLTSRLIGSLKNDVITKQGSLRKLKEA